MNSEFDSIKRVEVVGAYLRTRPVEERERMQSTMSRLRKLRTLRELADGLGDIEPADQPSVPAARAVSDPTPSQPAPRMTITLQELPVARRTLLVPRDGVVVVTDDGTGVADAVSKELRMLGATTEIVGLERTPKELGELVGVLCRRHGAVKGLLHLRPLAAPASEDDYASFRERFDSDVAALYQAARAAAIEQGESPCWLLAAARAGRDLVFADTAGVAGYVTTIAAEWPRALVKCVLLGPDTHPEQAASRVVNELLDETRAVRVAYDGARRLSPVAVATPLPTGPVAAPMDERSVVLATGGARGITAEVVAAIARRYSPTIVLVGRTPMQSGPIDVDQDRCATPQQLRAALVERARVAGEQPVAAQLEADCRRILRQRELKATVAALRACGATVEYHSVDVRDAPAVQALIDSVYRRHGRIDVLVHGAGVVEDKLVGEKDPSSFARVVGTKLDGLLNLLMALRPEDLRCCALFSSIAACCGNPGQADYAAANEALTALGRRLDQRVPGRVVSLCWGPWESSGMVSPEVAEQFTRRGVSMLAHDAAVAAFLDELERGRKSDVEVVIGDGPWSRSPTGMGNTLVAAPVESDLIEVAG